MKLNFKKMTLEKGIVSLQFTTESIVTVNPKHFVLLSRPKIDLESIAESVRHNYTEQISKGLFNEEVEKKMNVEIEKITKKRIEQNTKLPVPTIFIGKVLEVKHEKGMSTIKLIVTADTAVYFIQNANDIAAMVFELGSYPHYLSSEFDFTDEECVKVLQIKDEFLELNPSSKEMEDCFNPLINHFNRKDFHGTAVNKPYKRKVFKYKDEVLYTEK